VAIAWGVEARAEVEDGAPWAAPACDRRREHSDPLLLRPRQSGRVGRASSKRHARPLTTAHAGAVAAARSGEGDPGGDHGRHSHAH
jgi:hypothetical protein